MNSRQRFLAACRREAVDRPPAWMMRQAGRYLPEYRELREGKSFMQMVHDPEIAAEITLQPIRRFGMDAAVIFCDILVPAQVLGQDVEVIPGTGPVLDPPLRDPEAIAALQAKDVHLECAFLGESIRRVRQELGEERAIVGFCGAPFTLASYMVEGRSSRNFEHTKRLMLSSPRAFDELLSKVVEVSIPYLQLQVDAGADVLQIFDSWGGALDAQTYRNVLLPHVRHLVTAAKAYGVPVILYLNGGAHLLEVLADSGADVLSIDWRIDPADAMKRVGKRVGLQGNLDPTTLFSTPEVVEAESRRVLDSFAAQRERGYVFNLGSGILPKTPLDSVAALWRTVLQPAPSAS